MVHEMCPLPLIMALTAMTLPMVMLMVALIFGAGDLGRRVSLESVFVPEEVTVLLPFRNNEDTILTTLNQIAANSRALPVRLVAINNRSMDNTEATVRNWLRTNMYGTATLVQYSERASKADALASGLRYASTDLVALIDADIALDSTSLARLTGFLRTTHSDLVSGFILYNSSSVESLPAWDKCLSHGTIRLGRSAWGLCPNIPGQVVLARRAILEEFSSYHSFLDDLAFTLDMYRRGLRVTILPEVVGRELYPDQLGFLLRQRIRWLTGNLELMPKSIRIACHSSLKEAIGILLHTPIYHLFPVLVPLWLCASLFYHNALVIAVLLVGLYGYATWCGARNTNSHGTLLSLVVFVVVFPWIHLMAWIGGVCIYILEKVCGMNVYGSVLYGRR